MNRPPTSKRNVSVDDPIWLVVEREGKADCCFVLRASSTKVVTIGSAKNSDVLIEGVAPLSFFVEREGNAVWLTPGYGDEDLRVDTQRFESRRRVYTFAVVEVAGQRLVLRARDTPPTLRGDAYARENRTEFDLDAAFDEYGQNAPLHVTAECKRSQLLPETRHPPTAAYAREDLIPPDALPTETIQMGAIDFESWENDDAFAPPDSQRQTQRIAPLLGEDENALRPELSQAREPAKTTLLNGDEIRRALARRSASAPTMGRPEGAERSVEERKSPSAAQTPEPPRPPERRKAATVTDPAPLEASIQPQPTVELQPMRFEVVPSRAPSRVESFKAAHRKPNAVPAVAKQPSGDTTVYERPLLGSAVSGQTSVAGSDRPMIVMKHGEPERSPLEQLGVLTKRRPVAVSVGAAVGSFVLMFFLVGVSQLLATRLHPKATDATAAVSRVAPPQLPANSSPATSSSVLATASAMDAPRSPIAAMVDDSAVAIAVGHLVTGRHVEAEQAYRELAVRNPAEPSFGAIARILARRNSGDCRPANDTKKVCPTVKP